MALFNFPLRKQTDERRETHTLTVCLILLAVMASSAILFWKKKYDVFAFSVKLVN